MIDQFGIHLGPLYIRFYALLLISGMAAAAYLAARRAPRFNLNSQLIWDGLTWAIIPGLIGARIYHILTPSPASGLSLEYYLQNPAQMFAIWNGGLGIYGAIVGGVLGIYLYARRKDEAVIPWLDLLAPSMALGQAIGRWGNWVNQELYGAPTDLPWAIYIDLPFRTVGYETFERFHPLFLYESLWLIATCVILSILAWRRRDKLPGGSILLLYLVSYAIIRFLLDFLRLDSHGIKGIPSLTTAQLVSLAFGGIALIIFFVRLRGINRKPEQVAS